MSILRVSLAAVAIAFAACASEDPVVSVKTTANGLAAYVDPFIGTANAPAGPNPVANGQSGATFPGATAPFGMVQFSPDTTSPTPAGYHWEDDTILGFSLTHLNGAGCPSLRDLPIFPAVARPDFTTPESDTFTHDGELAAPGFYEVKLGSGILVDLTATQRTGFARFTFPEGSSPYVVLRGGQKTDTFNFTLSGFTSHIAADGTITGTRDGGRFCLTDTKYRLYYAMKFERPWSIAGTVADGTDTDGATDTSDPIGAAYFSFSSSPSRVVQTKIGLSYVSEAAALANLDAENPNWDFDAIHAKTEADWNARLGVVSVEGDDEDAKKALYTGLYHALVQPNVFSDVDGSYVGYDGAVRNDPNHARYSSFSGWDVYRSWVHLAAIVAPKETSDFVRSLVGASGECGALPRWALANDDSGMMVGDPASPTIAGAYAFGARDFDTQAAVAAMVKNGSDPSAKCNASVARPCLGDYLSLGFCSGVDANNAVDGHVSVTLEYAVADFAVATMAQAAGDATNAATFHARSANWKNVFDANASGGPIPQPRNAADQSGQPSFIPVAPNGNTGFTEGNPAQYTFFVPQDPYGLVAMLGGDDATNARLDALFTSLNAGTTEPNFYMGNEPQFATPWLYDFTGAPSKTAETVRRILTTVYSTQPSGLPGNDDLGATSAWQVWAYLGLYPSIPGAGTLVIGSPWFPKTTITLGSGKTLVITQTGGSATAPYVQSLKIGGVDATRSYVTWDEIENGQTLDFVLGASASATFGVGASDRPPVPTLP